MTWQENLFSNLLVVGVLGGLVVIVYCKITNTTLAELILSIRGAFAEPIDYE